MISRLLEVSDILSVDDGSLPDIDFDFGEERIASRAYLVVSQFASCIASENPIYWSLSRKLDVPIVFGDNPAEFLLAGDAEPFHLVFGGMCSSKSHPIPDLGVYVFTPSLIALDYRMGPGWNIGAVEGLFEIMHSLETLSRNVQISHKGNWFESHNLLLEVFGEWSGETGVGPN